MKRRFLALALALVMVVGLLPATVLTISAVDTPAYQSFSGAALADDVDVSDDGYTATITDTDTNSKTNQIYLYKVFSGMTNPHLTQTIQINNMPVFTGVANFDNQHQSSGYFNVMEGPRTGNGQDVPYVEHYIRYSIYRADDAGNLKLTIFKNNYPNNATAVTEENGYTVALNKQLRDEFTLTTVWNDHDTVSFYCGGVLLGTYDDVAFERGSYANVDALFFGYLPHLANTTDYAATTEIIVKNMLIADGHTAAADDGDCTTAINCSVCGAVVTPGQPHNYNKRVPADAYKKADTEREYYLSCVCGATSEGTAYEATYTVFDLYPATQSNDKNVDNYYTLTGANDTAVFSVSGHTAKLSGLMTAGASARTSLNFKNVFGAAGVDDHLSQTICITTLPVIASTKVATAKVPRGYYNLLTRNYNKDANTFDHLMYSITRIDNEGNLQLNVFTSVADGSSAEYTIPLGKKLRDTFVLTTVWHANDGVTFYVDGSELVTYENVTHAYTADGAYYNSLTLGVNGKGAAADSDLNADGTNDSFALDLTISNVQIAHAHEGGTATCKELAECAICGVEYGNLGGHVPAADDGDCTTDILCSVCGEVLTPGQPHNYNKKVPADAYKKADTEHEYYFSCVCGATSKGTAYEATFKVFDLYPATQSTDNKVDNYSTVTGANDTAVFSVSGHTAKLSGLMTPGASARTSLNFKNIFGAAGVDDHLSQTICITTLPNMSTVTKCPTTRVTRGYYNVLTRNYNKDANTFDHLMYSITRIDNEGNLRLNVFTSVESNAEAAYTISLGKQLGDTFVLTTVWHANDGVTFYVDGSLLATYENVTHTYTGDGAYYNSLTLAVNYRGAAADTDVNDDGTMDGAAVDLTISNVEISNGHAENDDGNCLTPTICTICGKDVKEGQANHVQAEDDGNCVTPVLCSNPGCEHVFVEGHELTHFDRVAPTDTEDGKKEYWYCAAHNRFFLNADGTSEVQESELTIPKLIQINDGKAEVSTESVNNAINVGGENVALDVPTSNVQLPADALDALVEANKDLVITGKDDGVKVTVNPDALAQINIDSDGSALSIEVKAGASLQPEQTAAVEGLGTVKNVVSATMFAGDVSITDFGSGTVTIEIPFEMDAGTTASDYKLYYVPTNGKPQVVTTAVFADGKMTATLDHFSEYAIVSTVAAIGEDNKATINTNGGSSVATVTGTYVDGAASGDVFSVAVEWDGLSFNYMAANTWDPENHTNTGGGWEEGTGSVTVVNHSNIDVTVTVTKEDVGTNGTNTNLGVDFEGFDGNTATDILEKGTEENVGELADSFTVEFTPRGTLDETAADGITLATITVRIEKYDEEAQN